MNEHSYVGLQFWLPLSQTWVPTLNYFLCPLLAMCSLEYWDKDDYFLLSILTEDTYILE